MTSTSQNILIALLQSLPDGVARMSDVMTDVVETSCNLGVVSTDEESASLLVLIRSLTDSCRKHLANQIRALSILAGAECVIDGAYPGWTPDPDSPIMHLARDTYTALYNKTPNIMVIHAGLECGLFKQPYPNIDMLSIGPTIRHPHSPDEKVDINSVERYWRFLIALLANIPKKGGST